jgi:hypothetical protein
MVEVEFDLLCSMAAFSSAVSAVNGWSPLYPLKLGEDGFASALS